MVDFPKDALKTLAAALRSKQFGLAEFKAAIEVVSWLVKSGGDLFAQAAPAGTLSASEPPLDDAGACLLFDSLASDDGPQAALDPAVAKAILAYLVQSLLPILMKKLTGN